MCEFSTSKTKDGRKTTRQLLGMKGAAPGETSIWKLRLQLMKPITWIPLMWGIVCGAASSGEYVWTLENALKIAACMLLSGPLMAGYTQTTNDFYDREIDVINEPYRPIPSGAISVPQVVIQILVLLGLGLALGYALDIWANHEFPIMFFLTLGGALVAYIYSAPPFKLKQNGWLGNYTLGASYIALPWWAGHALFGELNWKIVDLTLFYSFTGLGIAIVNDFKSVEGDHQLGLKSLPVMFGINRAAWICVIMIDFFQVGVAGYLLYIHQNLYAAILLSLVIPQVTLQNVHFLKAPLQNDIKYQSRAQPFLVLGMLVTGLALGRAGI
ncbi:bacteriochlorophyll/chlorophyll a synthase [cyanobacterium endosymbiont of Rhopalodia gibberula]|uniref:chlorophyll synthase ChlG n=1 Tax=cyanobacterium endosymbiont of Rhopalodia gibberula TaxID=1763363 RepID=UPI000DC704B0|nr:chlorophyll synthase ChlG [cyanobacterium endosymbiont of Rhopalodia gibberula]BBA80057.1 bacteriochlorophyll/chlorophyll a synthase [cyanobacterium endosymbiont of Rhopalodia gibberula]